MSTQERESAVQKLQEAYTRGQLEEGELDDRIRLALKAKLQSDLQSLLSDLPAVPPVSPPPKRHGKERRTSMNLVAHGSSVRKTGTWTVPSTLRGLLYKGSMTLDLAHAVLTSAETVIKVAAYKGSLEVIVPPGCRVETKGFSYKGPWNDETTGGSPDGPLIILKGFVYKGSVIIKESSDEEPVGLRVSETNGTDFEGKKGGEGTSNRDSR